MADFHDVMTKGEYTMFKRLLFLAAAITLVLTFLVSAHLTPASAHSVVSTHASVVDGVAKKKHHHHHYSGLEVNAIIQQNDAGKPTTFTMNGVGLTPNGLYDVSLDSFNDRCLDATLLFTSVVGDGTDVQADLEGRFTITVEIISCVGGTYSISAVNDALSGEIHEVHFHIKAA
jgi:hypothetical protein